MQHGLWLSDACASLQRGFQIPYLSSTCCSSAHTTTAVPLVKEGDVLLKRLESEQFDQTAYGTYMAQASILGLATMISQLSAQAHDRYECQDLASVAAGHDATWG